MDVTGVKGDELMDSLEGGRRAIYLARAAKAQINLFIIRLCRLRDGQVTTSYFVTITSK